MDSRQRPVRRYPWCAQGVADTNPDSVAVRQCGRFLFYQWTSMIAAVAPARDERVGRMTSGSFAEQRIRSWRTLAFLRRHETDPRAAPAAAAPIHGADVSSRSRAPQFEPVDDLTRSPEVSECSG